VIWRPSLLLAGEQADFCVVVDARSGVGLGSQGWRCLGSGLAVARMHRRSLLGAIQLPLFICVAASLILLSEKLAPTGTSPCLTKGRSF
jgi:hypothetical protein